MTPRLRRPSCAPVVGRLKSRHRRIRIESLEERVVPANWSGDIPDGTIFGNTEVQRIVGDVHVAQGSTLTIQPGTIVKFDFGKKMTVDGTLTADGSAAQSIVFTSVRDDSAGGDTDLTGPSSGGHGDWKAIHFTASAGAGLLDHVEVRYGGGYNEAAEVIADGADLTLTHSVLRNSYSAGLRLVNSDPVLTNNAFSDSYGPAISMDLASDPDVRGVTATNNGVIGVQVDAGTLSADGRWDDPDVVYRLAGDVTVPAGRTLTVAAGQVVKFSGGGQLVVNGTLTADGTPSRPIVFTADRDDTAGGDTNNNGPTTGGNGDWKSIRFGGTGGGLLDHAEVRYGGGYGAAGEVETAAAAMTLTNAIVRNSYTAGLRVLAGDPVVADTAFQNSYGAAASISLGSSPSIGGTATGNGTNSVLVDAGTLAANATWAGDLPYQIAGDVTIPAGATLTLAADATYDALDARSLLGAGTLQVGGTVRKLTGGGTSTIGTAVVNTGELKVQSGTLRFTGPVADNGPGTLAGAYTATFAVAGDLTGSTTNAAGFAPHPVLLFNGTGTAANPQRLEAMGQDLGAAVAGYDHNFVLHNLTLGNNTYVRLMDLADNAAGAGAEAVYVNNLTVPAGTTLDLNGLRLYARNVVATGTILGGAESPLPDGGPLVRDVPTPGKIAAAAQVDDWTIFGRAGDTLTVTLSTGGGLVPPLAPALGFGQVKLIDPQGNTLATQSNAVSGADATLLGITLPADGVYHIKAQAAPAQPDGTGNYVLTAWNAAVQVRPLELNQTINGRLDTPFRIDRWTFTGAAGQAVRFDLRNAETPAIQFDLTGPNGYTAFSNANVDSGSITLPADGAYALTVHGSQSQAGAYSFRVDPIAVTDLTLGTPFAGTVSGASQGQLFRVTVPQTQQLRVTLADADPAHRTEVYLKRGSAPTREDFD